MLGRRRPGSTLVHLQCHFGKDTLAWARAGAVVTGLDFSEAAVGAARSLADRAGLADRAEFVCAPVAEALHGPGRADLRRRLRQPWAPCAGSPVWDNWAAQVAGLLAPGGRLFLHESHPLSLGPGRR